MNRIARTAALVLACMPLVAACGGSGSSSTPDFSALQGTWFGTIRTGGGALHTQTVVVDAAGNLTMILQDGANTGLTGSIVSTQAVGTQATGYDFVLSDATEGGFMHLNGAPTHVAFIDDSDAVGILQKGAAAPLPIFALADAVATWTGVGIELDFSLTVTAAHAATATIAGGGTFTGNIGPTAFTHEAGSPLAVASAALGVFTGRFETPAPSSGPVVLLMSADKNYVAGFGCEDGGAFPQDCTFFLWRRGP